MRMMILALAVLLLAAPAWATVTITATHLGDGVVNISYDAESETELVRAFALDITVDAGNIVDIGGFDAGDDNGTYGIFPGNFSRFITVNELGDVDDWEVAEYTPVADGNDPGALGGLGTPGITIEMGALYETNAPDPCGVLCTITVSEDCTVTLALNGMRGNVVLETAEEPVDPVVLVGCEVVVVDECFPSTDPAYDTWVALEKPDCWCAPPFGSGYQCDGDADGQDSGFPFFYRVYTGDLTAVVNSWKSKKGDAALDPCADLDHMDSGFPFFYQVYTGDLTVLINNWKTKDADLAGDCGT